MTDFKMPSLGADMDYGTLVEWFVKPGDTVERGQVVATVETDKGLIDIEIWQDGTIENLLVEPGQKVPVNTVLATVARGPQQEKSGTEPKPAAQIEREPAAPGPEPGAPGPEPQTATLTPDSPAEPADEKGESLSGAPSNARDISHTRESTPTRDTSRETSGSAKRERVLASPLARKLASERGLDLSAIDGSGPGGAVKAADLQGAVKAGSEVPEHHHRISPVARKLAAEQGIDVEEVPGSGPGGAVSREDVERYVQSVKEPTGEPPGDRKERREEPKSTSGTGRRGGTGGMRQAIAAAMARSKREIPHYYLAADVDLRAAQEHLRALNKERSMKERLLMGVLYLRATVLALEKYPAFNGFWREDEFQPTNGIHPGFAISLREGGLIAPAILDAGEKDLDQLMADLKDLTARARAGRLRGAEMTRASITLSSLGDRGVDTLYGVIYPPQVALLGFGGAREKPVAVDGAIAVHPVMRLTLAADHRATDGLQGSRFLSQIKANLEQPEQL